MANGQTIHGVVKTSKGEVLPFAMITVKHTSMGVTADENGKYRLSGLPEGKVVVEASFAGFVSDKKQVMITKHIQKEINFSLVEHDELLDQITVTGTRTDKRNTKNPVIVAVINSQTLANVQACNLSEGLNYQTGLRVETDCQTCNYTQ